MQISFDSLTRPRYKITKPLRLIELFGGIGCQAQALKDIGVEFEHYRLCEIDKFAVIVYNAIHNTKFETSNVTKITAKDLNIVDLSNFIYLLTYSFPCQDLSKAGKGLGMSCDSKTRSSLLWEVGRLLDELQKQNTLPQILLMENVTDVRNNKNKEQLIKWVSKLEKLGYSNYIRNLNAKHYGIPQNRDRTFIVSIFGNYYYEFPQPQPLKLRLKHFLQDKVDSKYYLSEKILEGFKRHTIKQKQKGNSFTFKPKTVDDIANAITAHGFGATDNAIIVVGTLDSGVYKHTIEQHKRIYDADGICPAILTCGGGNTEPKILQKAHGYNKGSELKICPSITLSSWEQNNYLLEPILLDEQNKTIRFDGVVGAIVTDGSSSKHNNRVIHKDRIRKLTPRECMRLMGWKDKQIDKQLAKVSDTQAYKQAGNGIVIDVLQQIFKNLL